MRLTYYENAQNGDCKNTFIMLLAQYNSLQERQTKGTVDSRDYSVQFNKIIDALLEMMNDKL